LNVKANFEKVRVANVVALVARMEMRIDGERVAKCGSPALFSFLQSHCGDWTFLFKDGTNLQQLGRARKSPSLHRTFSSLAPKASLLPQLRVQIRHRRRVFSAYHLFHVPIVMYEMLLLSSSLDEGDRSPLGDFLECGSCKVTTT